MHENKKGSENMIQKETTGMILRKLRGDRTQEEIAAILGITKSSWAMYERDERVPRDEVKIRIANFFGKTVQELFYTPIEHYKCS
nr:MAG: helix-turn-helix domain protein [Bacteriophage sp.]UVY41364.1 MAG: helix-turn-helix domain protein [Bacteriophage sp.]UWD65999.1 MAG: helix-turn-helix domain protein [Bacteriophage sp.]UWI05504.1 MAG: helix-turn-helix domain protein [Bacteriophage sp.]